jgi:hypothetical protein
MIKRFVMDVGGTLKTYVLVRGKAIDDTKKQNGLQSEKTNNPISKPKLKDKEYAKIQ